MMKTVAGNRWLILGILLGLGVILAKQNPAHGIVLINDDTRVNGHVRVESRTGDNRSDNGNANTGDAIIGGVNVGTYTNTTIVTCCTPTPGNPSPTTNPGSTPTQPPGQPTSSPTPTGTSGGGGNNNGGGNGSNGGGGVGGGDTSGTRGEQGDILGLAATSSISVPAAFFQGLGLLCVGVGLTIKRKITLG